MDSQGEIRSSMADEMEECGQCRGWEDMIPDALGLIFQKLPLEEILTVIPRVCKSWERAVSGPYCWQEINIEQWSQCKPEHIDRMLQMLISRSSGSLRKLCVSSLPNDHVFSVIADHATSLRTLELPRSEISDSIVEQLAGRFSNITFLDISYCGKIGSKALEAIGKNCKSLIGLRRLMHPVDVVDKICQDDEANAISRTMPKLKRLELAHLLLTNNGVLDILSSCRDLEYLDIRGCWDVKVDEKVLKERLPGLKVVGPLIYWDNCSDYSDSLGYLSWEFVDYEVSDDEGLWDDGRGLEPLEVRFYGGFYSGGYGDEDLEFHWSPSP